MSTTVSRWVKGVTLSLVAVAAGSVLLPKSANAQAAVALLAWLQAAWQFLLQSVLGAFFAWITGTGIPAIVMQQSATTSAVSTGLQAHAATMTSAMQAQVQAQVENMNTREFGSLPASVSLPSGKTIWVGSNAPSACRRISDASTLFNARIGMSTFLGQFGQLLDQHNVGYGSSTAALKAAADAVASSSNAATVFALDWVEKPLLSNDDYSNAQQSIKFATNLSPLPPPANANTAVSKQYTLQMQQLAQLNGLPQKVLARQLALRAASAQDQTTGAQTSYLNVMNGWAKAAAEDPDDPVAAQAKTTAGVRREILLTLKSILAIENERMQSKQEANAMLALMTSHQLQERAVEIRQLYNQSTNSQ